MSSTTYPSATQMEEALPSTAPPPSPLPVTQTFTPTPIAITTTPMVSATPQATPCAADLCTYTAQFFLSPPVAAEDNNRIDVTYRFGSTQGGLREPHHGVEFLNGFGTPVLAAADGIVVVAGDDRQPISPHGEWPIVFYGPFSYFYGNLVIIEHPMPPALLAAFPDLPPALYTLYAHLSEVLVEEGTQVSRGQMIGKVGMSGVATGNHLHFEVRVGGITYEYSRNPELWLIPHQTEKGQRMGAIAGRILSPYGEVLPDTGIVFEYLPNGPDQPREFDVKVLAYEEKGLIGQTPFEESFAISDLPPGLYRLSFPYFGVQKFLVEVFPGALTVINLQVE